MTDGGPSADQIRAFAEQFLSGLGYQPLRDLPWRTLSAAPPAQFGDDSLESDLAGIKARAEAVKAKLTALRPDTDPYTTPLAGDQSGMLHNEALHEAQVSLERAARNIAAAGQAYETLLASQPGTASRLTDEDIEYALSEITRRREMGEKLLEYCQDPIKSKIRR